MFRKQLSHNLPHGLYLITSNELTHLGLYLFFSGPVSASRCSYQGKYVSHERGAAGAEGFTIEEVMAPL